MAILTSIALLLGVSFASAFPAPQVWSAYDQPSFFNPSSQNVRMQAGMPPSSRFVNTAPMSAASYMPAAMHLSLPSVTSRTVWSKWSDWGGDAQHDVAVGSYNNEGVDVFIVNPDRTVGYRSGHHGTLSDWKNLGGDCVTKVSAAFHQDGIDIACTGPDGAVWVKQFMDNKWSDWQYFGSQTADPPSLARFGPLGVHIFIRNVDTSIQAKTCWDRKQWTGWENLGGSWSMPPVGASVSGYEPRHAGVLAVDDHGVVYVKESDNGEFVSNWISSGDVSACPPSLAPRSDGFDMVLRGGDGSTVFRPFKFTVGFNGEPQNLAGVGTGCPAVTSSDTGRTFVFTKSKAVPTVLAFKARQNTEAGWTSWLALHGGPFNTNPVTMTRENSLYDVWITGSNNAVLHSSLPFEK